MNRPQLYKNSFLAIVLLLGLTAISASAQDMQMADKQELNVREMQSVRAAALRPVATTFWAVTQDFEGNFDNVDALMARFEREAKAQSIPNANPTGILVLYEDPTGKAQFRMAVGVTVTAKVDVKEPLKVSRMAFSEAVRTTHVGPYQQLGRVYGVIDTTLKERASKMSTSTKGAAMAMPSRNASWPVVLRLVSDPKRVKPDQLRTEVIVPVRQ